MEKIDLDDSASLDGILEKHFTNKFRKGHITVDGVAMPLRYKEMQKEIFDLHVNDEDVWLCSLPKTGTTWTQEMVWMIMSNLDFEGAKVDLYARSPFLEFSSLFDFRDLEDLDDFKIQPYMFDSLEFTKNQKSPICIKTHLPFNLLPDDIQSGRKKPKIIYVVRNPKDVCTSYYHHCKLIEGYTGDFNDFYKLFLAGKISFTPYWNHVLPFWKRRHEDNLLLLTFEELKKDLPSVIRKMARFLEKPLTDEQVDLLTQHLSFETMKHNRFTNHQFVIDIHRKFKLNDYEGDFMRSGSVGGFKKAMTPEMVEEFNRWIEMNTAHTDFNLY